MPVSLVTALSDRSLFWSFSISPCLVDFMAKRFPVSVFIVIVGGFVMHAAVALMVASTGEWLEDKSIKVHPHYAAWQNATHCSFAAWQKLLGICRQFDHVHIKKEFFARITKTVKRDQ